MARIAVADGAQAAFEAAVTAARPLFLAAPGCQGVELHKVVEAPNQYLLVVQWETVEHHTIVFRGSDAYARWRELVGPHFAGPPEVWHAKLVPLDPSSP